MRAAVVRVVPGQQEADQRVGLRRREAGARVHPVRVRGALDPDLAQLGGERVGAHDAVPQLAVDERPQALHRVRRDLAQQRAGKPEVEPGIRPDRDAAVAQVGRPPGEARERRHALERRLARDARVRGVAGAVTRPAAGAPEHLAPAPVLLTGGEPRRRRWRRPQRARPRDDLPDPRPARAARRVVRRFGPEPGPQRAPRDERTERQRAESQLRRGRGVPAQHVRARPVVRRHRARRPEQRGDARRRVAIVGPHVEEPGRPADEVVVHRVLEPPRVGRPAIRGARQPARVDAGVHEHRGAVVGQREQRAEVEVRVRGAGHDGARALVHARVTGRAGQPGEEAAALAAQHDAQRPQLAGRDVEPGVDRGPRRQRDAAHHGRSRQAHLQVGRPAAAELRDRGDVRRQRQRAVQRAQHAAEERVAARGLGVEEPRAGRGVVRQRRHEARAVRRAPPRRGPGQDHGADRGEQVRLGPGEATLGHEGGPALAKGGRAPRTLTDDGGGPGAARQRG